MDERELLSKSISLLRYNNELSGRYKSAIENFEKDLEMAKKDRYRIGVVGVTSSGKSTMLNAILGKEILSTNVNPSSNVLVTCSKGSEEKLTVYFRDKEPIVFNGGKLTPEIVKKYSDEKYNKKNRENVSMLDLSMLGFNLPEELLLVDSPGLDAYGLEYHEKLTLENLLPTIDFCIYVTTFKTNSDEKMRSVLNSIADHNCPLIIVQNMLDSVQQSPDGKKSSFQVVAEHKKRVERIVEKSDIKDKNSVRIVQISSKLALEGRLKKNQKKIKDSKYEDLVNAVSYIFSKIKPRIEGKRIVRIIGNLKRICSEVENDISRDSLTVPQFEFGGMEERLISESERSRDCLSHVFDSLSDRQKTLEIKSNLPESAVDDTKKFVESCGKKLLDEIRRHNEVMSQICGELGLDERRLRNIESFNASSGPRIVKKVELRDRKKDGLLNWFARLFGAGGYETYYYEEYDAEATRKNLIDYVVRTINDYMFNCQQWQVNLDLMTQELLERLDSKRKDYEARRADINDKRAMMTVIGEIRKLIASIPEIDLSKYRYNKSDCSNSEIEDKLSKYSVSNEIMSIYKLAEELKSKIHSFVMNEYGIRNDDINLIFSKDPYCTTMFLRNAFSIEMSEDRIEKRFCPCSDNVFSCENPGEIGTVWSRYGYRKFNYFVFFNASQLGQGIKEFNNLWEKISRFFRKNMDWLFIVVQDFEELRNGDGVHEALKSMKEMFGGRAKIMLNDNNPLYSLVALQAQISPCNIHTDEVNFIDCIKNFDFLIPEKYKDRKIFLEMMDALK